MVAGAGEVTVVGGAFLIDMGFSCHVGGLQSRQLHADAGVVRGGRAASVGGPRAFREDRGGSQAGLTGGGN
jgi:hypothetical protein